MNEFKRITKIVMYSIENRIFLRKAKGFIKKKCLKKYRAFICKKAKIDSKKITFVTFQGKYTCNCKAIAEELLKREAGFKINWYVIDENDEDDFLIDKNFNLLKKGSNKLYKELASSKFVFQNALDTAYMGYDKKDGQIFIQTWHGSMGFKKIDEAAIKSPIWVKNAKKLSLETDYIISNSDFEDKVYKTSYWPSTKILKYGHPRNDILLNKDSFSSIAKKVKNYYNIEDNVNLVLYAPTFRKFNNNTSYNLNYNEVLNALEAKFGGNWAMLVKFHPKSDFLHLEINDKVINATNYFDMQELICACDVGITDYSSWMCDFVITEKPGFLYVSDIEDYKVERGFYYPLSTTPFPISNNNNQMMENIKNFDNKKYKKNVHKFLSKMGCIEKGDASQKVVDKIIKLDNKAN